LLRRYGTSRARPQVPPMPDTLTPAEREAIARYTGPVQIIPRGVSGIPVETYAQGISWKAQIKAAFDMGKAIKAGIARRNAERAAKLPAMCEREGEDMQAAVERMTAEGHTQADIARFFGVSRVAISKRVRKAA
jgi:hypothetical protein